MSYFARWVAGRIKGVFPVKREPIANFDLFAAMRKGIENLPPVIVDQMQHKRDMVDELSWPRPQDEDTDAPAPRFATSNEEEKREVGYKPSHELLLTHPPLTVEQAINELNFFRCCRPLQRQMELTKVITTAAAAGDQHALGFVTLLHWNGATALH